MRARRGSARGQALVETALGILVFVTILVFGIHFAELGFLTPKVSEAMASALWDTTAKPMHTHPNNYSPRASAISSADSQAQSKYSNFDGRTGVSGTAPSLVFTRAGNLRVQCSNDDLGVDLEGANPKVYNGGNGGLACHASARMTVVNFPKRFLDQGGRREFRVRNYNVPGGGITVCGIGRANGGNCSGDMAILLDDWGLSDAAEDESSPYYLNSGGNTPYHDLVANTYAAVLGGTNGSAGGSALATAIVGADPSMGELKFWFSFVDGPDPEYPSARDSGDTADWRTNVYPSSRNGAYTPKGGCFLGSPCP